MAARSLSTQRYVVLINQLGDELGRERGWQTKVAHRLGISKEYCSLLLRAARKEVGAGKIEEAARRIGLDASFFYDEQDTEPSYRRYLGRKPVGNSEQQSVPETVWNPFLEGWIASKGGAITEEEARIMRTDVRFHHASMTATALEDVLRGIRAGRPAGKEMESRKPRPGRVKLEDEDE